MYDYIDSHVRYFDKMYAKRLRTYRKTGFSIWTQELQPKQIINAIFDSVNYTEKFEQDIVESEKMVVISSPDIRQDKIDRFLLLIKKRQEVGVKVTVITTDPEDITYGKSDVCYELIRIMQLVGINVITRTEVEECFAVIDDEIVWHGGMNLRTFPPGDGRPLQSGRCASGCWAYPDNRWAVRTSSFPKALRLFPLRWPLRLQQRH